MNKPSAVSAGLGCVLLCAGVVSALPGCLDAAPVPDVNGPGLTDRPSPTPEGLGKGTAVLGEYVLHVSPRQRTSTLRRLKHGGSARPGLNIQSVDQLDFDQDGVPGSGAVNTVELNTLSVDYGAACPSGIAASFCAHVELGNFYSRPLSNVFVQVTQIKDEFYQDLTDHGGINNDGAPDWLSDDPGLGLWKHTGLGVNTPGVVGNTPTSKLAPHDWEFADPDGAETYIILRVLASLSYSDYTDNNPLPQTFINACSLGNSTSTKPTNGETIATIPFPFTFYSIPATTTVHFTRDGVVTFGDTSPPNAANTPFVNVNLPEPLAPQMYSVSPGLYVFWDQLSYNVTTTKLPSMICSGTVGAAPNRRFIITWQNLRGFNDANDTMNLTFSTVLSEGSDTIDLVYGSMVGGKGTDPNVYPADTAGTKTSYVQRAAGKKAVIGVQSGEDVSSPFPAIRGAVSTATGMAYRFTPKP